MPRLRTSSGILRRKEDQLLRITPEILRIFGNPDKNTPKVFFHKNSFRYGGHVMCSPYFCLVILRFFLIIIDSIRQKWYNIREWLRTQLIFGRILWHLQCVI